jgi:hypothetical protein
MANSRIEKIYKTSGLNRRVGGHKYTDGDTEPILRTNNFTVPGGMDRVASGVTSTPTIRSTTPIIIPNGGAVGGNSPPSGIPEINAIPQDV